MTALVRVPLVASIVLLLVQDAAAQYGRRPPTNFQELPNLTIDGTVKNIQGNVLHVELAAGHPYLIMIEPRFSKLGISGAAKPDYLKPGMLVSFNADLPKDKKVEIDSPLTDLAIITASETNTPGAFEDKEKPDFYFVRGTVRSYKEGKLTVTAGAKQVIAPVPADADIKLDSTDMAMVRPGDTIKVTGKVFQQYRSENNKITPGQIVGQQIDIKLQETLTAATFKKKPGGK